MSAITLILVIIGIQALVTLLLAKGFFSLHYNDATEVQHQQSEVAGNK